MKLEQALGVIALSVLGWGSMQVYQMNANMAVISYKVSENHAMIKPMWQDFLIRNEVMASR